jgi:adenylosuccinate synthase
MSGKISTDQVNISNAQGVFADNLIGNNKYVTISNITLGGADSANYILQNTTSYAFASILSNTTTVVGGGLTNDQLILYNANVISKINKVEFTKSSYTYLYTMKQNSEYLQVDYIERGVNISVAGQ